MIARPLCNQPASHFCRFVASFSIDFQARTPFFLTSSSVSLVIAWPIAKLVCFFFSSFCHTCFCGVIAQDVAQNYDAVKISKMAQSTFTKRVKQLYSFLGVFFASVSVCVSLSLSLTHPLSFSRFHFKCEKIETRKKSSTEITR